MDNVLIKQDLLYAVIYPPSYQKELRFSGYAKSFSSVNEKGPFDILPTHENFVSVITGPVVIEDEHGVKKQFAVENAVLEASGNLVKVFVKY